MAVTLRVREHAGPRTRGRPTWPRWRWRGAAVLAGALPVPAFPEPALSWLAWGALVPWLVLVRRAPTAREAGVLGWCGAAGFLTGMHHWLAPYLLVFLPLVVAALAVLWVPWAVAAWGLLSGRLEAWRVAGALLVVPAAWVAVEAVRSWAPLGGPWGLLGTTQGNAPVMLASASLGGVWLVGALVVAANTALLVLVEARRIRLRLAAAVAALAVLLVGPAAWVTSSPPAAERTLRVGLVQPGVVDGREARFDRGVRLTRALPPGRLDLVVWGESSVGFDLDRDAGRTARLAALSRRLGSDLLVNVDARDGAGAIRKSAVRVGPRGVRARYEKQRLVPFGEYVPLRPLLGWLTGVTEAAGEDRRRGQGLVTMRVGGATVAPLVCFESAFPDMSRAAARRGADLVVFQSSTSSFQGSWAPEQHAALAAVRAAETGRPAVHATLTGTTAAYDARGRRLAWFGTGRRGGFVVDVPLTRRETPYVRYGDWVLAGSAAVLVVALLGALATGPRRVRVRAPGGRSGVVGAPTIGP
jgi:apolipoprotein N-acyltransferase